MSCRLVVYVIFLSEPLGHIFSGELVVSSLLPQVGGTFVKGNDIAEVDVLLAFRNDYSLAADSSEIKSSFLFNFFLNYYLSIFVSCLYVWSLLPDISLMADACR